MKKILLIHGWDWKNYPKFNSGDAWQNRMLFIKALQEEYEVDHPALPGFGDSDIPKNAWNLDDYAKWIDGVVSKGNYDAILGYSFGGAVLTHWAFRKVHESNNVPKHLPLLFLTSPAIVRKYQKKDSKFLRINRKIRNFSPLVANALRHLYLSYWIKNQFYIHGGEFQRKTYANIVTVNLSKELSCLTDKKVQIYLFFGEKDTATPPELLFELVPQARNISSIIAEGGHDIANSHTDELKRLIVDRLSK